MSDLTNGIFALVGTAVGAGIAQIAPVVTSINSTRQQRRDAAAKDAQARALLRRPLYTALIAEIDVMTTWTQRLSFFAEAEPGKLEELRSVLRERLDRLYPLVSRVEIDGSDRAARVALSVAHALFPLERLVEIGYPRPTAQDFDDIYAALDIAHNDLVDVAREEFGG